MTNKNEEIQEKPEEKQPPKEQSLMSKVGNFFKKSASALGGAALGGIIGSVIPVVGTLVGAMIGAVVGRVAESGVNYLLDSAQDNTPAAAKEQSKSAMFQTPEAAKEGAANTAQMTAQLGGTQAQASLTEQVVEQPIATPRPAPGAKQLTEAFFDASKPTPGARSPLSNPAALPRLVRGAASAA